MARSRIFNSLLRIDGATGEPLPPFERPNVDLSFWVLELQGRDSVDIARWCAQTAEVLINHTELLQQLRLTGARFTLFIESAATEPVFRLEAPFLKIIADIGISLEHHRPDDTDA